jgi:hypothetical protein
VAYDDAMDRTFLRLGAVLVFLDEQASWRGWSESRGTSRGEPASQTAPKCRKSSVAMARAPTRSAMAMTTLSTSPSRNDRYFRSISRAGTELAADQVIDLRQNRPRHNPLIGVVLVNFPHRPVNAPTLFARRGRACLTAYSATASRTSSAGARPARCAIRFSAR